MKISLEFVPEWAADSSWPLTQNSLLTESIETGLDVNNYYIAQWAFFKELFMLDNGGEIRNPFINMGSKCVTDMWKLVMSQADLADPTTTFDPKSAMGRVVIQTGITEIESSRTCEESYSMADSPISKLDDNSSVMKRYVRFAFSKDSKIIFINMTNEPSSCSKDECDKQWYRLNDAKDHGAYRASFYESLFTFLRGAVSVNNAKGDTKVIVSRYPVLSLAYNYCLSYGS